MDEPKKSGPAIGPWTLHGRAFERRNREGAIVARVLQGQQGRWTWMVKLDEAIRLSAWGADIASLEAACAAADAAAAELLLREIRRAQQSIARLEEITSEMRGRLAEPAERWAT